MKFTNEAWARLTENERSWLVTYHKHCNEPVWDSRGGDLPDDCSYCPVCGQAQIGGGVCSACMKDADRLYKKMEAK